MLLTGLDPTITTTHTQKQKQSCVQGVTWNIKKIFQKVSCSMPHLSWKFHENPLMHFPMISQTNKRTNTQTNRWKHKHRSAEVANSRQHNLYRAYQFPSLVYCFWNVPSALPSYKVLNRNTCQPHRMAHGQHLNPKWMWLDEPTYHNQSRYYQTIQTHQNLWRWSSNPSNETNLDNAISCWNFQPRLTSFKTM